MLVAGHGIEDRGLRALAIVAAMAGAMVPPSGMPASGSRQSPPIGTRIVAPRPAGEQAQPLSPELRSLQERAAAVARAGRASVGFAAIDLTSGAMISVNGGQRFPMASTVKIAIAAAFLHAVQQGRLGLDRDYAMPPAQRRFAAHIGDMRLYRNALSGGQLIEMMLIRSDNSAADILLDAIGGTRAVARFLQMAGVEGQRVDRSIAELLDDHQAARRIKVGKGRRRHWITVAVPRAAAPGDVRDSSTPEAMAALIAKLRQGELLDAERTAYLFDVMARCRTGPNRIRGLLPAGTFVAHKTGTMNGITDDVGIVTLPNGHDVAIAVFETGPGGPASRDRNIAQLSRLVYDGFGDGARLAAREAEGMVAR